MTEVDKNTERKMMEVDKNTERKMMEVDKRTERKMTEVDKNTERKMMEVDKNTERKMTEVGKNTERKRGAKPEIKIQTNGRYYHLITDDLYIGYFTLHVSDISLNRTTLSVWLMFSYCVLGMNVSNLVLYCRNTVMMILCTQVLPSQKDRVCSYSCHMY